MSVKDSTAGYGSLSIALHWIGAALVIALFILGNRLEDIPKGPDFIAARNLHVGLGVIGFAFLAARILWRLASPVPHVASNSPALDRVAVFVQAALLALIAVLIVTGPLSIWAGGRPINLFDIASIPSPMPKIDWLHEGLEVVHAIASKAILVLVGLHVLGALKHAIVDRDGLIRRMLVPAR